MAQPEKRQGGRDPVERRPDEDRHEDEPQEIPQPLRDARSVELTVVLGHRPGQGVRIRQDDATPSTRDVLAAAETEDPDVSNGSKFAAFLFHSHRLGRILHHEDPARLTKGSDSLDVRRDTEQVVSDHRQRVTVHRLLQECVVEVEGRRADVAEHGFQAGFENGGRHRKARVGRDHDLGPGRQGLQSHERESQGGRSR
jgi:hypothetical protein